MLLTRRAEAVQRLVRADVDPPVCNRRRGLGRLVEFVHRQDSPLLILLLAGDEAVVIGVPPAEMVLHDRMFTALLAREFAVLVRVELLQERVERRILRRVTASSHRDYQIAEKHGRTDRINALLAD